MRSDGLALNANLNGPAIAHLASPAMTIFVYGSLMAGEVLHGLLGRVPAMRGGAVLPGYVRHRLRGEVFPAIVPAPGSSVAGLILDDLTVDELRWFDWFEVTLRRRRTQDCASALLPCVPRISHNCLLILGPVWIPPSQDSYDRVDVSVVAKGFDPPDFRSGVRCPAPLELRSEGCALESFAPQHHSS